MNLLEDTGIFHVNMVPKDNLRSDAMVPRSYPHRSSSTSKAGSVKWRRSSPLWRRNHGETRSPDRSRQDHRIAVENHSSGWTLWYRVDQRSESCTTRQCHPFPRARSSWRLPKLLREQHHHLSSSLKHWSPASGFGPWSWRNGSGRTSPSPSLQRWRPKWVLRRSSILMNVLDLCSHSKGKR